MNFVTNHHNDQDVRFLKPLKQMEILLNLQLKISISIKIFSQNFV